VALASDNLACEVAVSERCAELGIPLVQASVYGPTLTAQVRAISNRDAGTDPCLCCGFVRADWEELNRGTRYSCAGARGAAPEPEGTPTVSPPQLCATAAALAFTEVMNRVVGVRDPDSSVEIAFHGTSPRLLVTELKRSASCPAPHVRSALREWSGELASARVGDLVREAVGATERLDDVSFAAQGYRFVGLGFCGCLGHPRVDRFLAEGAAPERCGRCGLELAPHPMTAHAEVPARVLSPWLDRTLGELGAAAPGAVRVRHHPTSTLFSGARPAGARS
jgi:hypothetical protein